MINSGIYQIRNTVNNHIYIGSTNNFKVRRGNHLCHLRGGTHYNSKLQSVFKKYGEKSLVFELFYECNPEKLFEAEQYYLDMLQPEYNISKTATVPRRTDYHHSPETIEKIRKSNLGKNSGKKPWVSLSNKTRENSEETRRKHGEAHKGKEYVAKMHGGLVSPEGIIYRDIFNMSKFCREHVLNRSKISELEKTNGEGRRHKHRGWSLYKGGI